MKKTSCNQYATDRASACFFELLRKYEYNTTASEIIIDRFLQQDQSPKRRAHFTRRQKVQLSTSKLCGHILRRFGEDFGGM